MAQLTRTQQNLIEVAMDAPLDEFELRAIDNMARAIITEDPNNELWQLKQIKVNLLISERINQLKESN